VKRNVLIVLHRFIVDAFIIIHHTQFIALFKANEKLKGVPKVLTNRRIA
jgi:hypothetical protein